MLGTLLAGRPASGRVPGFVVADLHRRLTVLALVLLVGHVAASVADSYVTITWLDAVVPFVTTYRPLWTGLGTLACDVLLLVAVTSALRHRMSARAWRAAHLSAYAMWPLAVLHTLGDGSDARSVWLPLLTMGCVLAVVAAGWWRLQRARGLRRTGPARHGGRRPVRAGGPAPPGRGSGRWRPAGPSAPGRRRRPGPVSRPLPATRGRSQ